MRNWFVTYLICGLIISLSISCNRKIFLFRNEKTANYNLKASDGKKIEGFLYIKMENLKTKYFSKTDRFNSPELLAIKREINKIMQVEKMLIYSSAVSDSFQVGLYNVRIVDIDVQKAHEYFGSKGNLNSEIKSLTVPVLKFKNEVRINTCFNCTEQQLKEAEKSVEDFKSEYSKMFNAADLEVIASSFMKGIKTYSGHGRYRD